MNLFLSGIKKRANRKMSSERKTVQNKRTCLRMNAKSHFGTLSYRLIAFAGVNALQLLFSWDLSAFSSIPINIPFILLATTSHMIMLTVKGVIIFYLTGGVVEMGGDRVKIID